MNKDELDKILEKHTHTQSAKLEGANLIYANLEDANLEDANLINAKLEGANLEGANLRNANLEGATMRRANLPNTNLISANLIDANMRSANLEGANLRSANLPNTNLINAKLEGANLEGANLRNANLEGANLNWTIGNMKEVKTLMLEEYHVTYTAQHMFIGCESHTIEEWFKFSDNVIESMAPCALTWWNKWKEYIRTTIEMSPAEPTGHEEYNYEFFKTQNT